MTGLVLQLARRASLAMGGLLCCALMVDKLVADAPPIESLKIVNEGSLVDGPLGPSVQVESADWHGEPGEKRLQEEYVAMLPYASTPLLTDEKKKALDTGEPPGSDRGFLQNFDFVSSYMIKPRTSDFGMTEFGIGTTVAVPFPTRWLPLLITPRFEATLFDGPQNPDLPGTVYDSTMEFRWLWLLGERKQWIVDLSVAPGWHGDYVMVDDDTVRVTGRALGIWQMNQELLMAVGMVYLDRDDEYNILPAAGLIWTPDGLRVEMVFPRPSIAWRLFINPYDERQEYWGYVAAELGGGEWTITRESGAHDVVSLRDYRLALGLEHKFPGGINSTYEAAYVFARKLDYQSNTPDFDGDDTVLFRAALRY